MWVFWENKTTGDFFSLLFSPLMFMFNIEQAILNLKKNSLCVCFICIKNWGWDKTWGLSVITTNSRTLCPSPKQHINQKSKGNTWKVDSGYQHSTYQQHGHLVGNLPEHNEHKYLPQVIKFIYLEPRVGGWRWGRMVGTHEWEEDTLKRPMLIANI